MVFPDAIAARPTLGDDQAAVTKGDINNKEYWYAKAHAESLEYALKTKQPEGAIKDWLKEVLKAQDEALTQRRAAAGVLSSRGLAALVPAAALHGRSVSPESCATIETTFGQVAGLAIPTGITLFVTPGVSGAGAWLRELVAETGSAQGAPAILGGPVATLQASRRAFVGYFNVEGEGTLWLRVAHVENLRHDLVAEVERPALNPRLVR